MSPGQMLFVVGFCAVLLVCTVVASDVIWNLILKNRKAKEEGFGNYFEKWKQSVEKQAIEEFRQAKKKN